MDTSTASSPTSPSGRPRSSSLPSHSSTPPGIAPITQPPAVPSSVAAAGPLSEERAAELRFSHKIAERRRRGEIRDLFDDLQQLLPLEANIRGQIPKVEVLARSIEYIKALNEQIGHLRNENSAMQQASTFMAYPPNPFFPGGMPPMHGFTYPPAASVGMLPRSNFPGPGWLAQRPQGSTSMEASMALAEVAAAAASAEPLPIPSESTSPTGRPRSNSTPARRTHGLRLSGEPAVAMPPRVRPNRGMSISSSSAMDEEED